MTTDIIPTRIHAISDYVTGAALVAAPTVLGLDGGTVSALAPRVVGLGATTYSALTDYELGVRRVIPMPVHLAADAMAGVALAAAPRSAGDARRGARSWRPHAVVGAKEVLLAALTQTRPADERLHSRVGRLAVRGAAKAPGSAAGKAKAATGSARAGVKAGSGAVAKVPGSARDKARVTAKAARKARSSKPSLATRIAVVGLGIGVELARSPR